MKRLLQALRVHAFILAGIGAAQAEETQVDVELMLAVDVSYSISTHELEIQRRGYAEALRDPAIWRAIEAGYFQKVAIAFVEWSNVDAQRVVAPWTLIESPEDLERFANTLESEPLLLVRRTSISGVLDYAVASFETNGFSGDRRVIDVSGDGPNNMGRPVTRARDDLLARGFTINGLPLMTFEGEGSGLRLEDIDLYYVECVIGGPFSFSIPVRRWEEFPAAVRRKLILELASRAPEGRRAPTPVAPVRRRGQTEAGYDCLIGEKIWRDYMGRF